MARKPRLEVEGGLYHVLSRGNNRQLIFRTEADYRKMLGLLSMVKMKLPFFLYSYCLMTNHFHLLIERQQATVGQVMHRLLTGYSRYHNRKYKRVGHLLQSRYKAILCQSDQYLAELIRYIHLNPVRAGIVLQPEAFPYSSHRAYLGLEENVLVDIDPILRHFGSTKKLARERFELFVNADTQHRHSEEYYPMEERRILGSQEFIQQTKKTAGEFSRAKKSEPASLSRRNLRRLVRAAADATGLASKDICSPSKTRKIMTAKEAVVIVAQELGARNTMIAKVIGLDISAVSRRLDSGKSKMKRSSEFLRLVNHLREEMVGADHEK